MQCIMWYHLWQLRTVLSVQAIHVDTCVQNSTRPICRKLAYFCHDEPLLSTLQLHTGQRGMYEANVHCSISEINN